MDDNAHILSPSQFVELINETFDALGSVAVEGEVDEYKVIHNKWAVFNLKDEDSTIPCFMPVWNMRTQIEDGMLVRASGKARLRNKGFFSFTLTDVQPSGEGALKRAFELLKQKLAEEGLFAEERKRALPRFPRHIALITSRDAAAYSDFLKVLNARQGGLSVSFLHVQVQGEDAPNQIIGALEQANTELDDLDAIVLVRGGGGLEDLHAFNDEQVVRAVAGSRAPIIVGIGHERDICLAELAADMRASTPSNAAELLVRSREELIGEIAHMRSRLSTRIRETIAARRERTARAMRALDSRIATTTQHIARTIQTLASTGPRLRQIASQRREHVRALQHRTSHEFIQAIKHTQDNLARTKRMLESLSPERTMKRGFSITRAEDGSVIRDSEQVTKGAHITTALHKGSFEADVTDVS